MTPLPDMYRVYATVVQEESHKGDTHTHSSAVLGLYAQIDHPNLTHSSSTTVALVSKPLANHAPS